MRDCTVPSPRSEAPVLRLCGPSALIVTTLTYTCPWRINNCGQNPLLYSSWYHSGMRDLILLFVHVLATSIRLVRPGGVRSVLAESVLLKHQLLILNRSHRRAPNLRASDRLIAGLCALLVLPRRLVRSAVVVKPSTLLNFHRALVHRKYRLLFSPKHERNPDRKAQVRILFVPLLK